MKTVTYRAIFCNNMRRSFHTHFYIFQAHSSYQSGASSGMTGGAVRNLQPLPLNRNGTAPTAPLPPQPVKRDGIKEWYV